MTEFKPFEIAKRMENRVLIGIAAITASIIVVGWIAINENARMQEFTDRSHGRSVEAGARIFESTCTSCHGTDGQGLPGLAPALNNPQFFGFSFFRDIDTELGVLEAQISKESDPTKLVEMRARQAELQAERLDLKEIILYGWADTVAELDQQIADLDAQIVQLEGVDNASRLPVYISQRESTELAPLLAERDDLQAKSDEAVAAAAPVAESTATAPTGEATPGAEVTTTPTEAATAEPTEVATAEPTEAATAAPTEAAADGTATATPVPTLPGLTEEENARYAELVAQIDAVNAELKPYKDLSDQRAELVAQRGRFQAVVDAQAQVVTARTQLADLDGQLAALGEAPEEGEPDPNADQRAELVTQAQAARKALESTEVTRKQAYDALVKEGDILDYDPEGPGRLEQLGWTGGLNDFVRSTVTGGRPTSASYWPKPMVAWGQLAGGPLRPDQVQNLVDYITNWDREFTIAEVRAVRQFAKLPADPSAAASNGPPIEADNVLLITQEITALLADETLKPGDPAAGETAFQNFGCSGCHGQRNGTGPAVVGVWTRAQADQDERLTQTGYVGDPQSYLIQSIAQPNAFVVPNFNPGIMPQDFTTNPQRLGYQDLLDILAYLETHTE